MVLLVTPTGLGMSVCGEVIAQKPPVRGCGYYSTVEPLPSMLEALGSNLGMVKRKERKKTKEINCGSCS